MNESNESHICHERNVCNERPDLGQPVKKPVIKRKRLDNEYVLTNKHIICKFKYLLLCFDHPENPSQSGGLLNLPKAQLQEAIDGDNLELSSSHKNTYFWRVCEELKKWHPQISKVEVDLKTMYDLPNLLEYDYGHVVLSLGDLAHNICVRTETDYQQFLGLNHKVVDVKVYFRLLRRIERIEDYQTNFNYLHELMIEQISQWNQVEKCQLEEVYATAKDLPYLLSMEGRDVIEELGEENTAVPYLSLLPLHSPVRKK